MRENGVRVQLYFPRNPVVSGGTLAEVARHPHEAQHFQSSVKVPGTARSQNLPSLVDDLQFRQFVRVLLILPGSIHFQVEDSSGCNVLLESALMCREPVFAAIILIRIDDRPY